MIRLAIATELADQLNDQPEIGDAEAFPVWPGDKWVKSRVIFSTSTTGTISFPLSPADSTSQDDFKLTMRVYVAGMPSVAEAATRRDELVSMLIALVAADMTLGGFSANNEQVDDFGSEEPITVATEQGEAKEIGPLATADITIPIQTRTFTDD